MIDDERPRSRCRNRRTGTCMRLLLAVDDATALESTLEAAHLKHRVAAGTPIGTSRAGDALVELYRHDCACRLLRDGPLEVVEALRHLLAAERRVQLLLQPASKPPSLEAPPLTWTLRQLLTRGLAALPPREVVEIVLRSQGRNERG